MTRQKKKKRKKEEEEKIETGTQRAYAYGASIKCAVNLPLIVISKYDAHPSASAFTDHLEIIIAGRSRENKLYEWKYCQ